ncbi:L,D-transpeptidase [Pelagibacterium limicola]|uniref:L,D-transpeptidase n=1 Tax=Pelagibacterium limicola TaxID=2791022 RepID=UPI0018AF7351|nr:L,D-transpeptidase [Pelagibacterium limicola]
MKTAFVFLLLVLSAGLFGGAASASQTVRVYDADLNAFVDRPTSGGLRGSPIKKQIVEYRTNYAVGTIVVETGERRLYLVLEDGKAMQYGIGVGRDGATWSGTHRVTRKAEWPDWRPTVNMLRRDPSLPRYMEGGPDNPLGARALYIGSTMYRLHGTSEPWSIGQAVSSGCIRLTNEDIIDLYNRVEVGATVVVRR